MKSQDLHELAKVGGAKTIHQRAKTEFWGGETS